MSAPSYAKMPNTVLLLACGPAEWRRLMVAAHEGGSPLWIDWLRETYLASVAWRRKREERLQLDAGKCACCGRATAFLDVYHKTEARLGDEDISADLETLCPSCHTERELEARLDRVVEDETMLRSMKQSLKLFTHDSKKRAVSRSAIAMLG